MARFDEPRFLIPFNQLCSSAKTVEKALLSLEATVKKLLLPLHDPEIIHRILRGGWIFSPNQRRLRQLEENEEKIKEGVSQLKKAFAKNGNGIAKGTAFGELITAWEDVQSGRYREKVVEYLSLEDGKIKNNPSLSKSEIRGFREKSLSAYLRRIKTIKEQAEKMKLKYETSGVKSALYLRA